MPEQLPEGLLSPDCYPHDTGEITLVETHISWVILTGEYAYKIKKPVDYGFLDFSTLEKRKYYCEEELRLNSRFGHDLYLAVVAITVSGESLRIAEHGDVLDYAVKMRQFNQEGLLDRLALAGRLTDNDVLALAGKVAHFHGEVAAPLAAQDSKYGTLDAISGPAMENFRQIRPLLADAGDLRILESLEQWTLQQTEILAPVFAERRTAGFVRECHGDLHLANIARIDGKISFFDCIEFNPALRWIDTMSELAFLLMDMEEKRLPAQANLLLNAYLEHSGDYGGLRVLDFYKAYRAMVKAKVELLRIAGDEDLPPAEVETLTREYRKYIGLARRYRDDRTEFLAIMHGVSGTGKSTVAGRMAAEVDAVRVRSDVERKRLFGLSPDARSDSALKDGLYSEEASDRTFAALADIARDVLQAGYPVIVDATFIRIERRRPFMELARELAVPFVILDCRAREETLVARLEKREREGGDPSEAGIEVMRDQQANRQPFSKAEQPYVVAVDTEQAVSAAPLLERLEK